LFNESDKCLFDDLSKTLEDVVMNGQKILLEVQSKNNTWPRESKMHSETKPKSNEVSPKVKKKKLKNIFSFFGKGGSNSASTPSINGNLALPNAISKSGTCGLNNLGNTCFMNSALQCLSNTTPLTDYFLNAKYKNDINRTNPLGMKGKIAEEYGSLLRQLWNPNNAGSSIAPRNFKVIIGKYAPQFSGYNQNDSQELLAFLLDGLHEDLNRVIKKPSVENNELTDKTEEEMAKIFWENHLKRDQSIIVDLFQGQLKSKLVCPKCNHVSTTFDPFMYLSLPLAMERETYIEVILVKYTECWEPPIKYSIKIDKFSKIEELKEELEKLSCIKASRLVVADIYLHKLASFLERRKSVSTIRSMDVTIAYEMSVEATDNFLAISVTFRREKKKNGNYNSVELFGIPFLIWIEPKKTTGKQIYQLVWNRIKNFFPEENDANEIPSKFPFRLAIVSGIGTSCGKCSETSCKGCLIKCRDKPPKLKNSNYFSIDLDSKTSILLENIKMQIHPTVEEAKSNLKKSLSLTDCLNLFTSDEKLGLNDTWYCPKCKEFHRAMKKFDLWSVPQILVIHLKRFLHSKYSKEKLATFVQFPLEGLDLSPFVLSKQENLIYDLFAVSNHR